MNADTTQYLSTTEFANRYNAMMPIDKDHMPLEPSFVELLCEKGEIEHSELPPGKGHKKYIYKIPEYELDKVAILINGDQFLEKAKSEPSSERNLLTTKEVSELISCYPTYVNALIKEGKLVPTVVEKHGSRIHYKFDEDYILNYMETHPMRTRPKNQEPVEAKPATEDISKFQKRIDELLDVLNDAQKDIQRLTEKNKLLLTVNEELSKKTVNEPVAKDIFEAYRKGFKDGYEMGGGK